MGDDIANMVETEQVDNSEIERRMDQDYIVSVDAESLPERMVEYDHKPLMWNREEKDLDVLSDRELLEELCRRVVDYHATSLKFHDCEGGTADELMENDNNYCRVREVVQQVLGIDLEYVEEVKN